MLLKICRCGKKYPTGKRCSCKSKQHKFYDRYKRNKDSQSIYLSKEWEILRQLCKDRCHGIDMYKLMETGRPVVVRSGLCHHIIEVTEDKSLAYNIDNLIYVSASSHALIHKVYEMSDEKKKELQNKLKKFLEKFLKG